MMAVRPVAQTVGLSVPVAHLVHEAEHMPLLHPIAMVAGFRAVVGLYDVPELVALTV